MGAKAVQSAKPKKLKSGSDKLRAKTQNYQPTPHEQSVIRKYVARRDAIATPRVKVKMEGKVAEISLGSS